jgi:hypothetical protein
LRSAITRKSSAVAPICDTELTTIHHAKGVLSAGSA